MAQCLRLRTETNGTVRKVVNGRGIMCRNLSWVAAQVFFHTNREFAGSGI
jgi:hypothetical protein